MMSYWNTLSIRSAAGILLLGYAAAHAQTLLLDRSNGNIPLAVNEPERFLTDAFSIGNHGETWVIDRIRVWAVPDPRASPNLLPGDLFHTITLRGGLWTDPPAAGTPDCGCHGLVALSTAPLVAGSLKTGHANVQVMANAGVWQIDFSGLSWSVPGASRIQFGVEAKPRSRPNHSNPVYIWYARGSVSDARTKLHVFAPDGNPVRAFGENGEMNVQVWAHRSTQVSITGSDGAYRVTIKGQLSFNVHDIDIASLRFGPEEVPPESVRIEDADNDRLPDLVGIYSMLRTAIPTAPVSACVRGTLRDRSTFAGCDLAPATARR